MSELQRKYYIGEKVLFPEQEDGSVLYATDEKELYIDAEGERNKVGKQVDWNEEDSTKSEYIKNKPTLGTAASLNVAESFEDTDAVPTVGQVNETFYNTTHWIKLESTPSYGVKWNYSNSSPQLIRTGGASEFENPSPATSVNGTGSSPFDDVYPWSDMKVVNILSDGTILNIEDNGFSYTDNDVMVWIPEFYYRAVKDESSQTWTWDICEDKISGFKKHPGSGRYIGKYHTSGSSSGVYSKSGVVPLDNVTKQNFRTYSHNKGANWYMMDIATWSAIQMLYLIEFANFDSQTMLGRGWTSSVSSVGGTNNTSYHTLKITNAHNQYRWIEDPMSNVHNFLDGVMLSSSETYIGINNAQFTDNTTGLTKTALKLPSYYGCGRNFGYDDDFSFAFIPNESVNNTNYNTFLCDHVGGNVTTLGDGFVGGASNATGIVGFFYINVANIDYKGQYYGSRLIYIPSKGGV